MQAGPELSVITKAYDLILWFVPIIGKFPRNHRFVLGERMERGLYDLLEGLIRAKYRPARRRRLLDDANLHLELLRFQSRMATDLDLLSLRRYEHVARQLDGIGQEVGGWLRSERAGAKR